MQIQMWRLPCIIIQKVSNKSGQEQQRNIQTDERKKDGYSQKNIAITDGNIFFSKCHQTDFNNLAGMFRMLNQR